MWNHGHPFKIKIACGFCKSEDVSRDANAMWSESEQRWELSGVFDAGYCNNCDGESRLIEIRLDTGEVVSR